MVIATLTTYDGVTEQRTFHSIDALTEHLTENHGKYESVDAKTCEAKDLRQGRTVQQRARKEGNRHDPAI